MRTLRSWIWRLVGLFHKGTRDLDIAEELESHLQLHAEENQRAGLSVEESRRRALLKLGGVEQTKELYRDRSGIPWIESLIQDLRFGLRMLGKNPGFTAVAVLTLALGIGTTTAIFSVVDAVLLRPVAAPEPDRVVVFMATNSSGTSSLASEIKFNVWREQTSVFEDVSAYRPGFGSLNLTGVDQP
jgi:macrolide transport system ATP-binding/permease protein